MNINFEYKDVAASKRLEALAIEKLDKLENKYDFIVAADVYFKNENTKGADDGKTVEIRLNVPGATLFSSDHSTSFEASIAKAVNEVGVQAQKKKDKMQAHH